MNSPGGVVGALSAALVGGAMFLRKYWLTDKVDKAVSDATSGLIASMSDQIEKANARADAADKRADEANDRVQSLLTEISDLRTQVLSLTARVEEQNRLLTVQTVQLQALRGSTP